MFSSAKPITYPQIYQDYVAKLVGASVPIVLPPTKHGLAISVPYNIKIFEQATVTNIERDIVGITPTPLAEVDAVFSDFFSELPLQLFTFDAMSVYQANDQVFLHIPQNTPAQEIKITSKYFANTITQFYILAQSPVTLFIETKSESCAYVLEHVHVRGSAPVKIVSVVSADEQTHIVQKRNITASAKVEMIDVLLSCAYAKLDVMGNIQTGGDLDTTVLYYAKNEQLFDIYTESHHTQPHGKSNIVTRGAISDKAKVLSRGLVKISESAFGCAGYEQQDALLLSNTAEADAIPNLEIHNHDVTCSHGSTIGRVNEEDVFYLMSRGLSKTQAKAELIRAYFEPVLKDFPEISLEL